jgi:hypothetical protein
MARVRIQTSALRCWQTISEDPSLLKTYLIIVPLPQFLPLFMLHLYKAKLADVGRRF